MMHSSLDQEGFPQGTAIFASDNVTETYYMLYFDERTVSRMYEVSFQDNILKWWRNAPGFSQRCSWTLVDEGQTILGKGELSKDGSTWEKDLELTMTRVP